MFGLNIVEKARNTRDKEGKLHSPIFYFDDIGQMIVAEENDACYDDGEFQESE